MSTANQLGPGLLKGPFNNSNCKVIHFWQHIRGEYIGTEGAVDGNYVLTGTTLKRCQICVFYGLDSSCQVLLQRRYEQRASNKYGQPVILHDCLKSTAKIYCFRGSLCLLMNSISLHAFPELNVIV